MSEPIDPAEPLRMNAYYYSFDPTGVPEIDRLLSAVATAGKHYHGTEDWGLNDEPGSETYAIQQAAQAAAEALAAEQAKSARVAEMAHRFELIPRARLLGALTARAKS